jgi:hypothetical protein
MEKLSPESSADVGTTMETDDLDTQDPPHQQPDIETTTEIDDSNTEDPPHQKADSEPSLFFIVPGVGKENFFPGSSRDASQHHVQV